MKVGTRDLSFETGYKTVQGGMERYLVIVEGGGGAINIWLPNDGKIFYYHDIGAPFRPPHCIPLCIRGIYRPIDYMRVSIPFPIVYPDTRAMPNNIFRQQEGAISGYSAMIPAPPRPSSTNADIDPAELLAQRISPPILLTHGNRHLARHRRSDPTAR